MNRTTTLRALATATALIAALTVAGCAARPNSTDTVRLGWSGEVPPLDPAASDSIISFVLLSQLYPSLFAVLPEQPEPSLEIATSAEWTEPGVFTVQLKPGLTFANGNQLTSSDVKFSIERQLALQSEDGAWRNLERINSVDIVDATTLEFHIAADADMSLPYVLAGPAGLVLDEESFYADELTPDDEIIAAEAFAGAFSLTAKRGDVLVLSPHSGYAGVSPSVATIEIHPGSEEDLATQITSGSIDAIVGPLSSETVLSLSDLNTVMLSRAGSGRVRVLAFDLEHMPFGSRTEEADDAKATALRTAISHIIDREAVAGAAGSNAVRPLYGYLPPGIPGAADVFSESHGDGKGGPDVTLAQEALAAAAIETPVDLSIHVDLDSVGEAGSTEATTIASQLAASGLFTVSIVDADRDQLHAARLGGETQAVFTSLLPVNADPQDYLVPYRSAGVLTPGFADSEFDGLLTARRGELDPEVRAETLLEAQLAIAAKLPAIPITQGVRVVFARPTIDGIKLSDSLPLDLSKLRH